MPPRPSSETSVYLPSMRLGSLAAASTSGEGPCGGAFDAGAEPREGTGSALSSRVLHLGQRSFQPTSTVRAARVPQPLGQRNARLPSECRVWVRRSGAEYPRETVISP